MRTWAKSEPYRRRAYRLIIGVAGGVVVVGGLALVPFPGPGWLIVLLGLGLLSSEFTWAQRLQREVRRLLTVWVHWFSTRSWPVRALVTVATMAAVCSVMYVALVWSGVPSWVPDGFFAPLPGL